MMASAGGAVPYSLLRHQGAMLRATTRMLLQAARRSLLPSAGRHHADAPPDAHAIAPLQRCIAAPPVQLVEHYIRWCGADGRYDGTLPPHMVSQWSLPLVSELLMQLPYRLTGIINQGVSMIVHGPLPRGEALMLHASVEQITHADGWARIVVAIVTGTAQHARLVETRLHMRVRLPGPRSARKAPVRPPDPAWQNAGAWRAESSDGLRFSLLTGDFNPIHWCGPLARRSVFGAKVLHGFGSLARSCETLAPDSFHEIEVRFLRPVVLDGEALSVQLAPEADTDGRRALRLVGADNVLHLAGWLR